VCCAVPRQSCRGTVCVVLCISNLSHDLYRIASVEYMIYSMFCTELFNCLGIFQAIIPKTDQQKNEKERSNVAVSFLKLMSI